MCPLVLELLKEPFYQVLVCNSGQHRDMVKEITDFFGITINFDLNVMKPKQSLAELSARITKSAQEVISLTHPDILCVHGDTTTAKSFAEVGFYNHIPVAHIEAGLRTNDILSPFPEEFNRIVIDKISTLLFAPTEDNAKELIKEGLNEKRIYTTGNTVIDSLKYTLREDCLDDSLKKWIGDSKYIILTAHRRENLGEPMKQIFNAVSEITYKFPEIKFIYPMHPNPIIKELAQKYLRPRSNLKITKPLNVFQFHNLLKNAYCVLTDSGGIQEECCGLKIPTFVMREHSERQEGVNSKLIRMIGCSTPEIISEISRFIYREGKGYIPYNYTNPYGDGHASEKIAEIIKEFLYA